MKSFIRGASMLALSLFVVVGLLGLALATEWSPLNIVCGDCKERMNNVDADKKVDSLIGEISKFIAESKPKLTGPLEGFYKNAEGQKALSESLKSVDKSLEGFKGQLTGDFDFDKAEEILLRSQLLKDMKIILTALRAYASGYMLGPIQRPHDSYMMLDNEYQFFRLFNTAGDLDSSVECPPYYAKTENGSPKCGFCLDSAKFVKDDKECRCIAGRFTEDPIKPCSTGCSHIGRKDGQSTGCGACLDDTTCALSEDPFSKCIVFKGVMTKDNGVCKCPHNYKIEEETCVCNGQNRDSEKNCICIAGGANGEFVPAAESADCILCKESDNRSKDGDKCSCISGYFAVEGQTKCTSCSEVNKEKGSVRGECGGCIAEACKMSEDQCVIMKPDSKLKRGDKGQCECDSPYRLGEDGTCSACIGEGRDPAAGCKCFSGFGSTDSASDVAPCINCKAQPGFKYDPNNGGVCTCDSNRLLVGSECKPCSELNRNDLTPPEDGKCGACKENHCSMESGQCLLVTSEGRYVAGKDGKCACKDERYNLGDMAECKTCAGVGRDEDRQCKCTGNQRNSEPANFKSECQACPSGKVQSADGTDCTCPLNQMEFQGVCTRCTDLLRADAGQTGSCGACTTAENIGKAGERSCAKNFGADDCAANYRLFEDVCKGCIPFTGEEGQTLELVDSSCVCAGDFRLSKTSTPGNPVCIPSDDKEFDDEKANNADNAGKKGGSGAQTTGTGATDGSKQDGFATMSAGVSMIATSVFAVIAISVLML